MPIAPRLETAVFHEQAFVRAFILPQRQERYLSILGNPRRRHVILDSLYAMKHINPQYVVPVLPKLHSSDGIYALMKKMGAPEKCWLTSEWKDLDSREMGLLEALREIIGSGVGTWLSSIPGVLGFAEDEEGRWLLHRPPSRGAKK